MTGLRAVVALAVLCLATAQAPAAAADPLGALVAERARIASRLAAQSAYCTARRDTGHAAFAGCIDWHSAVHGTWSLVAYELATGDRQYSSLLSTVLSPERVARERALLRAEPAFEMPYGRAWLLRLAIDHERLRADTGLAAFADEVAASLLDHLRRRRIDPLRGSYGSHSWALINLYDYAVARGDAKLREATRKLVLDNFVTVDPACPYELERGHFMAVCTNWAALAARVMGRDDFAIWADMFIRLNGLPEPVARPAGAHHYGLNFSRAWGLWDIYAATGRDDAASAYAAHFRAGYAPATNWSGDYRKVGHWVAQFGMYALQPLFAPDAAR
jgi:hypothetical protein